MALIDIMFRCEHSARIDPDKSQSPVCAVCGERQIARTVDARAPRFVGHARGPLVESSHLGSMAVQIAERPLTLKEP